MDNPSTPPIQRRRGRWPVILLVAALIPAAVLAVLWFGLPPRVPTTPIRLVRGENGLLVPVAPQEQPSLVSFEIQAGKIEANNQFSSSSTSSRSGHSGLACGRLVIMNHSDHLLMARIGQLLLDELKPLGYIHQIDYYPVGFNPEQGKLAPDVAVTIDLDKLAESGWPGSHTVEATFTVTAGNGPPGCRNSYSDHLTPPVVQFDWNGTLHHTSTTTGLNSSAAKYKLVAENVAKQIAETLTKEFKERREKEGIVPELPQAFYPPYRKPPALPLADFGNLELITSWHGLMNHNETLWRLTINRPVTNVLGEMRRRLEATGWKTRDTSKTPDQSYLRMSHNDTTLMIYVPSPQGTPPSSSPREPILNIQYVDRMTQDELRAAIDESLTQNVSTDILVCFEGQWSEEQSRRILKALQSRPVRTPQTALTLANLCHRLKQDDNARRELLHAQALLRTVAQYSDLESKARNLAKDLGDEKLVKKPIEPPVLKELGFVELKPGIHVPAQETGLEEPVHFFAKTPSGSLNTVSLRVVKSISNNGGLSYQLAFVDSSENSRSWGTGGTSHNFLVEDKCNACFSLVRLGTGERFRLTTRLSGQ